MYFFSFSISIDLMFHSPYYVHSQPVSCCLVPCFECVSMESACIFSLSPPSINLIYVPLAVLHNIMYILSR